MTYSRNMLALGLLGLGTLSPVWGDEEKSTETPDVKIFEQLDKDQDGKLVADEIPEDKKRFFDQLVRDADANKDGVLDKSEYLTPPKEKPAISLPEGGRPGPGGKPSRDVGEMFKRADKNGDGKLSIDEIPEKLATRLKPLMEKAGKDEISREDLEKLMDRRQGGEGNGKGGKGGPPPGGKGGRPNLEQVFEAADKDGDGKIQLKDVTDRGRMLLERVYDKLGKEPDDSITLDELKEAMPGRPEGSPDGRRPDGPPGGRGPGGRGPEDDPEMPGEREGGRPPFGPPGHPKFFVMLDKDEDGQISKAEIEDLAELFKELDEDEDGLLSPRELLGPPPHERGEMRDGEEMPRQGGRMKKGFKRPMPPRDASEDGEKPEKPEGEKQEN